MKITIVLDSGKRCKASLPYDGAHYILIAIACPNGCASHKHPQAMTETKIAGTGIKHHSHDTYFADAIALCCRKKIGTIETKVDTVFGIEEDERVLNGPQRVY